MFCTTWSLLRTILDPASCWLSQSCDSYAAAFAVEIWAKMGQITSMAWKNTSGTRCQHNFNSGILVNGKTRMAPKTSKTTTAGWLATNSKTTPVAVKCQINNQRKPGSTWEKLIATYNFASLFCTAQSLFRTILNPSSWWMPQSCDSYAAASFCRDVGPNGPNNKHRLEEHLWPALPAQLQQWHPCQWQD